MTNDEKVKNLKKRQVLLILIIIFGLLTLIFSILSIIFKFTFIPALIFFIIEYILSKVREKIKIKEVASDLENQE